MLCQLSSAPASMHGKDLLLAPICLYAYYKRAGASNSSDLILDMEVDQSEAEHHAGLD